MPPDVCKMNRSYFDILFKNAQLVSLTGAYRNSFSPLSFKLSHDSGSTNSSAFKYEQDSSYSRFPRLDPVPYVSQQTQLTRAMIFSRTILLPRKSTGMLTRTSLSDVSNFIHSREYGTQQFTRRHHPLFGQVRSHTVRRKELHVQDGNLCSQKLALPSWMTSWRPFYKSDCEKAFKEILSGKLKETIFWDQFLDIGCGAGDLTRSIVKVFGGHHRVLVATETSLDAVKVLRRNAAERDILYEVMDIEKDVDKALKTWGRFRRIFSFYHLEKIGDKRLALANMRELLIDNGELFLLFQMDSNLCSLFQDIKESDKWKHVAKDFEECALTKVPGKKPTYVLRDILTSLGFEVAQCKLMTTDWILSNQEKLEKMIIATSPFLHRVPKEKRDEFIEDCTATAAKLLPNNGGVDFKFSYSTIMVQATRVPDSCGQEKETRKGPCTNGTAKTTKRSARGGSAAILV
ncbi:unnamed protein product [Ixodes hexagonus]